MAKAKKKRASKYDQKLAIQGSFEDVIKVSVSKPPDKIKEEKSKAKDKK